MNVSLPHMTGLATIYSSALNSHSVKVPPTLMTRLRAIKNMGASNVMCDSDFNSICQSSQSSSTVFPLEFNASQTSIKNHIKLRIKMITTFFSSFFWHPFHGDHNKYSIVIKINGKCQFSALLCQFIQTITRRRKNAHKSLI